MGTTSLKCDIQQAIANNVKDFNANYRSLIFDNDNREHIKSLFFIENLNIKVQDNKLLYNVKINEEAVRLLSLSDIKQIQKTDIKSRIENLFIEKAVKFKLLKSDFDKAEKVTAVKMAKLNEGKRITIKTIQQILKEKFNLETKLKESRVYLSLEAELQEFNFNREMLKDLENMFNELDVFAIVPQFNDVYDDIQGVRFFMGIGL